MVTFFWICTGKYCLRSKYCLRPCKISAMAKGNIAITDWKKTPVIIAFIARTLKTRKTNVTLEWLHFPMVLFARARQCFAGVKIREKLFTIHKFTNLLKSVWRSWFTPRGKFWLFSPLDQKMVFLHFKGKLTLPVKTSELN